MNPGQQPWTVEEFDRKVALVARELIALRPDVVGLQELWHRMRWLRCWPIPS